MKIKVKENSFIAFLAAKKLKEKRMAIVLFNTIYLYNTKKEVFLENKSWVCHEITHVEQFKKMGT